MYEVVALERAWKIARSSELAGPEAVKFFPPAVYVVTAMLVLMVA